MIQEVIADLEKLLDSGGDIVDMRDYFIEKQLKFFGLPKIAKKHYPEILVELPEDQSKRYSGNCCYDCEHNFIYLNEDTAEGVINPMCEETMHFINLHFNGSRGKGRNCKTLIDFFYANTIAESIAHLSGKFHLAAEFDERLIKPDKSYKLFLKHLEFEANIGQITKENFDEKNPLVEILTQDLPEISETYHYLGYHLGERMYKGYHKGLIGKPKFKEMIHLDFKEEMTAMSYYLELAEILE